MMKSKELRAKAWNSLKGKYWLAVVVVLVMGFLSSIGSSMMGLNQDITEILNMVDPSDLDATMEMGAALLGTVASTMGIVGVLVSIFVDSAATVGVSYYFIENTRSKPSFADAFRGFKVKYFRNIGTMLLVNIKTVLWSLLFVIPGIIKAYEYAIIPYILADDPKISSKEAFKKARQMMKGNKWRLFKLNLSFIGWGFLCVLTMGVGTIFLMPYVSAAAAEFYMELKNK